MIFIEVMHCCMLVHLFFVRWIKGGDGANAGDMKGWTTMQIGTCYI